ncbi:hypothetical protein B1B04_05325 [Lysinibacillus sp. KCTC 33748]|uniref:hypothetical protein n=1 Tax=unclassified Lysinibacillus TaxID=2636778 RepID=UPI0009A88242|nr:MULTISPECIES: hypothetical protein [unclassified Lysinibacillus]OXS76395.1 hypothetical protein B1B04_05325 [Lysinibacillus sp. KCTC 33748]SKB45299.1 hypothetical protein SAMN06295926_102549 [Lysinibacillus sp. AC-3]
MKFGKTLEQVIATNLKNGVLDIHPLKASIENIVVAHIQSAEESQRKALNAQNEAEQALSNFFQEEQLIKEQAQRSIQQKMQEIFELKRQQEIKARELAKAELSGDLNKVEQLKYAVKELTDQLTNEQALLQGYDISQEGYLSYDQRQELKQLITAYENHYPTTYSDLRNLKGSLDKLIDFLQDQSERLRVQQFQHTIRDKKAQDTERICTPEEMLKEDILGYCKKAQNNVNLTEMYMKWLDVRADISFNEFTSQQIEAKKESIRKFHEEEAQREYDRKQSMYERNTRATESAEQRRNQKI